MGLAITNEIREFCNSNDEINYLFPFSCISYNKADKHATYSFNQSELKNKDNYNLSYCRVFPGFDHFIYLYYLARRKHERQFGKIPNLM